MNGLRSLGSPNGSSSSTPWSYTHHPSPSLIGATGVSRSPYSPRGRKLLFPSNLVVTTPTPAITTPISSTNGAVCDSLDSYFENCKALLEKEINRVCCSESYCVNEPLLLRQVEEISFLRTELQRVSSERDALAIQVEQLNMEILAGELGRLDSSYSLSPSIADSSSSRTTGKSGGSGSVSPGQIKINPGVYPGGRRFMGQVQSMNSSQISGSGLSGFGCLGPHYEEGDVDDNGDTQEDETKSSGGQSSNGCVTGTDEGDGEMEEVLRMCDHLIPQRVDDDFKLARYVSLLIV
jgi:hypothetical protein